MVELYEAAGMHPVGIGRRKEVLAGNSTVRHFRERRWYHPAAGGFVVAKSWALGEHAWRHVGLRATK